MIIYRATNKINGMIYIGQTVLTLKERKKSHLDASRLKNQTAYFPLAVRKYGLDSFLWEEIDSAENMEELNSKEQKWIKELNSVKPNGYNLTSGGRQGGHLSDYTKELLSKLNKERYKTSPHPFTGRKHSEDTKEKISKARTGLKQGPHSPEHREKIGKSQKGIPKPHSPEWCENQRNKMTGRKHSEESKRKRRDQGKCCKIYSPETGMTYGSIKKAALEHGISRGNLSLLINGKLNFLRDKKTGQKLTFRKII